MSTDAGGVSVISDGLGPLPPSDGSAEVPVGRAPGGGTEVVYVDAWSEDLVRAYAAEQVVAERERWIKGHDRYEVARLMNPGQWADACRLNVTTGKPFDQIIDELAPFYGKTVRAA